MKLSKIAILALRGSGTKAKGRIAKAIGVSQATLYKNISDNAINGDLTKASAIKAIQEETGLTQDDILEESQELTKTG